MTIKRAMKEIHVTNPVKVKWNGKEDVEYLRERNSSLQSSC